MKVSPTKVKASRWFEFGKEVSCTETHEQAFCLWCSMQTCSNLVRHSIPKPTNRLPLSSGSYMELLWRWIQGCAESGEYAYSPRLLDCLCLQTFSWWEKYLLLQGLYISSWNAFVFSRSIQVSQQGSHLSKQDYIDNALRSYWRSQRLTEC